jgi:signal transduction histidine kinase
MMILEWRVLKRMHRSITVLAATLIGVVTAVMLLCAVVLLVRFGGDDDGTWGAADVADALKTAVARNEQGQLIINKTSRLDKIVDEFPTFWYVVSDKTGEVTHGPVPKWRPSKTPMQHGSASFLAYAVDGTTRNLKRMTAIRDTPVGEILIETGGVAHTASQLTIGTLTDATFVALPILIVLVATAFAAMVFVPPLIARPVRAVAAAAETIDGVIDGRRLPEDNAPAELLPLVAAFNRALSRIDTASKAQRNFLSNAAHELRTPLTNVRTMLEQIQDPALRTVLVAENQKLSAIVTMLLQLARLSMEPTELSRIDLVALGRNVTAEHVPMALKHGSDIAFTEPGGPVWVQGSEAAITVALSNLIRNAVHHARSDRPILVEVCAPARLSVIDSGAGVELEKSGILFEPFKRGKTSAEGMGLGLSIVSQVMALHNGSVAIQETPGGGTTIELSFPEERHPANFSPKESDQAVLATSGVGSRRAQA